MLRRKFAGTPGKPGFSTVMVEAFNVMQDRITRARLAGDPPDVIDYADARRRRLLRLSSRRRGDRRRRGTATEKSIDAIREAAEALA